MNQFRIIRRSMKYGTFYKLPKKIIKSFERNKINLSSIKLYLLLQEYIHENHTCIIDPEYFGLINKEFKYDLVGGIELLRVFGLISYQKNDKGQILIYFEGYNEGFEFEYEAG